MNISIVKTLPHLQSLWLAQHPSLGWASSFSYEILDFAEALQAVRPGDKYKLLLALLSGYARVQQVQAPGEYTVRGDTLVAWPVGYEYPVRVIAWGDEIESVAAVNLAGAKIKNLSQLVLSEQPLHETIDQNSVFLDLESTGRDFTIFTTHEVSVPENQTAERINTDYQYPNLYWSNFKVLEQELKRFQDQSFTIFITSRHGESIPDEIWQFSADWPAELPTDLAAGFISQQEKRAVFTDRELFGSLFLAQRKHSDDNMQKLLANLEGEIKVGDFIVHQDHGVGIYAGLTQEFVEGQAREYLLIKYADEDQLFVPIDQIDKLSRYIGDGAPPKLSKLSGRAWANLTEQVRKTVMIKAQELVEHYARRSIAKAKSISSEDSKAYQQFCAKFPHPLTHDQLQALAEINADLQQESPMNRLLVGDVGFGKTEVAMRAAFKMIEAGAQVALLAPTTILAAQHFEVWRLRLEKSGLKVGYLSRWHSGIEVKKYIEDYNAGKLNVIIGTHKLLSSGLDFKSTGLLIVDEEQKFGVRHKETIRKYNYDIHYLAVSATPIPRTLGMALSKLQDISLITTPPHGRKPVETEIIKLDWNEIANLIRKEIKRGGQVYFVHNEVQTIPGVKAQLQEVLPELKIAVGHGQMAAAQLESAMHQFYSGEAQILLASSIIENGLDLEKVNTILINKAHKFGLANLYQLRGRVGRSNVQAYCYLIYDKPTKEANERLLSIKNASHLGAGFSVASKDLELRGAGELLGAKQSGQISKVGYALYMQLLAQEITKLRAGERLSKPEYVTL